MPAPRIFPRRTLENALRVPEAIKQHNAGNPWNSKQVAQALNLGPGSGNFFYVTAAARDYGLTEGTRDTAQISLTPLGKQAVYPANPEEEREARLKAFLNVEAFRNVIEYYGGNNLPERQFLSNTLTSQFSIPEEQHDEFVDILSRNCDFLGISETFDVRAAVSGDTWPHIRDVPPKVLSDSLAPNSIYINVGSISESMSDTITVDAPEGDDDAPICFVIMPFSERDDAHPAGFFDEVLEQLFTPAAKQAGFLVRTARRQGSDIIQSTIVNDLLEADLVLCDLTEHNPNVLFELGLRISAERPVVLVKAKGTGRVFDVDNMMRVVEYNPNLWPSTVHGDITSIEQHVKGTWADRESDRTFMRILRRQS